VVVDVVGGESALILGGTSAWKGGTFLRDRARMAGAGEGLGAIAPELVRGSLT